LHLVHQQQDADPEITGGIAQVESELAQIDLQVTGIRPTPARFDVDPQGQAAIWRDLEREGFERAESPAEPVTQTEPSGSGTQQVTPSPDVADRLLADAEAREAGATY
jgi:hypothetical protein